MSEMRGSQEGERMKFALDLLGLWTWTEDSDFEVWHNLWGETSDDEMIFVWHYRSLKLLVLGDRLWVSG